MGWYFSQYSRKDMIEELTTTFENDIHKTVCLKHCTRGNVLWSIWHRTFKNPKYNPERFIVCDLMQRSGEMWGYKPMDESMGPCYYTCPRSYLNLANNPNINKGYNPDWRQKVRNYHCIQKEKRYARKQKLHTRPRPLAT